MTSHQHHSVQTGEDLGRRFASALLQNSDSKSDVLRDAIVSYVESTEGETVHSIERRIDELEEEKTELREEIESNRQEERQVDDRIETLKARRDELTAHGDHDELFAELVGLCEAGTDLSIVAAKTEKVDTVRQLGDYESTDAVIDAVEEAAGVR